MAKEKVNRANYEAKKKYGQNFLEDASLLENIIEI